MHPLARALKGDPWHPTRFHACTGEIISLRSWLDLPRVLLECAGRELFQRRPEKPWIAYSAIRHLSRLLRPSWRVLEFGAGMSTLWFARRSAYVYSIESNGVWYEQVKARLSREHLTNVTLEHRSGEETQIAAYADLSAFPPASFDCILIDGHARDACVTAASRVIAPEGCILLDNIDLGRQWPVYARAAERLRALAAERGGRVTIHTGLAPAQLMASQAMLVEFGEV